MKRRSKPPTYVWAGALDGPYRRPGWFARLMRRLAWLVGSQ